MQPLFILCGLGENAVISECRLHRGDPCNMYIRKVCALRIVPLYALKSFMKWRVCFLYDYLRRLQRKHFWRHRGCYLLDDGLQKRFPDEVLAGQHDDLPCGGGNGKRAYKFFLSAVQLQNGQPGDEGYAFAALHHAHERLHAAKVVCQLACSGTFELAEAFQLVAEAVAFVQHP